MEMTNLLLLAKHLEILKYKIHDKGELLDHAIQQLHELEAIMEDVILRKKINEILNILEEI